MWQDVISKYKGQKIAVWCARYVYAGIVEEVGEQVLTLNNASVIEVTGSATAQKAETTDRIPSELHLNMEFIENVCRPTWLEAL